MNAFPEKIKHRMPRGRYFFSQTQMRNYRWLESLMFARAKRAGQKVGNIVGSVCGCGCGPVPIDMAERA